MNDTTTIESAQVFAGLRFLNVDQGSPSWLEARRGRPTASEFDKIITPAKGALSSSCDGYIARLIDEMVRPDVERDTFQGNVHTERGKMLEEEARSWYELVTENLVSQTGLVITEDGFACSPDAIVEETHADGSDSEFGALEIKCPDGPAHVKYLMDGGLPNDYKVQVHGQMAVLRVPWIDFLSYCPPYPALLIRVRRDAYTDTVEAALKAFMLKFGATYDKIKGGLQK